MKKFALCMLLAASTLMLVAQDYYVPDGYTGWYDYDHRIIRRSSVKCDENYQDLWNGCTVRIYNNHANIYDGSDRILYGTDVWLLHNGWYIVSYDNDNTERVLDAEGNYHGTWGNDITIDWNGVYHCKRGDYYRLYDGYGNYLGIYSTEKILIFWNGYYFYKPGDYYRVANTDFEYIGVWGDDITLLNNGNFRCKRGDYYYDYDINGDRVY